MVVRGIIISILSLLCQFSSFAQQPGFIRYTDLNGLPSLNIYDIIQDNTGYLWLATENGLCRFDGKKVVNYSSPLINDFEIMKLHLTDDGQVWFTNFSGQLFTVSQDTILRFKHKSLPADARVYSVSTGPEGAFWLSTNGGFYEFKYVNRDQIEFRHFYGSSKFNLHHSNLIIKSKNEVWVPQKNVNGVFGGLNIKTLPPDKHSSVLTNFDCWVRDLGDGQIAAFSISGAGILEKEKYIPAFGKLSNFNQYNGISNVFKDQNNQIWVITKNGAYLFDAKFQPLRGGKPILKPFNINCMLQDREGNFWIGTNGSGLLFISTLDVEFYNTNNSGLALNQVFSLGENSNNELIIGMGDGKIDYLKDQSFKHKDIQENARVLDIAIDPIAPQNDQYFATDKGLFLSNMGRLQFLNIPGASKAVEAFNGELFIGTSSTLYRYNTKSNEAKVLMKQRMYCLFNANDDTLWVAGIDGLQFFANREVSSFKDINGNQITNRISSIERTQDGTLYLGTLGQGLIRIQNQQLDTLDTSDGLASNIIKSLFVDSENNLYIGTDHGLNVSIDGQDNFELINRLDGLNSNEINTIFKHDNLIWLGTPQGICSVNPNGNYTDTLMPTIQILEFLNQSESYSTGEILSFPNDKNDIQINFQGISFRSQNQLSYKYQLLRSGNRSDWVKTDAAFANFQDLSPGRYTFMVSAVNADGYESKKASEIQFEVRPIWYNTLINKILILCFSVLLTSLLIFNRFKRKQKQIAQMDAIENQVNTLRQQAMQAQMNPHFIFNAMNSIMHFLSVNDRKSAMDYLAVFARLIRMIFEFSSKEEISLNEEIRFLKHYIELEQLRFEDRVETEIRVDESLKLKDLSIPPLLIQPLIENAYKHGLMHKKGIGKLSVLFKDRSDHLFISIEDNGVGREKASSIRRKSNLSSKHKSAGLKTTRDRLNILAQKSKPQHKKHTMNVQDLIDSQGIPCGTRVEVQIPFPVSALENYSL